MMSRIIQMDAWTDFNEMCTAIAAAREAMRTTIEAREKPEIVHIFVQTKQYIHAQAKASEIYFEETKNGEAKRKAREARLRAECLMVSGWVCWKRQCFDLWGGQRKAKKLVGRQTRLSSCLMI